MADWDEEGNGYLFELADPDLLLDFSLVSAKDGAKLTEHLVKA